FDASRLMSDVARPCLAGCRALADIMHERRESDAYIGREPRGLIDDHHHVHAGIDLRMMFGRLRNAVERVQFREKPGQRTASTQRLEKARGQLLAERTH